MAQKAKRQALYEEAPIASPQRWGRDPSVLSTEAQNALWVVEARYRSLMESSTDGIFCLDLNMRIQVANGAAAELYEFASTKEMEGVALLALVAPSHQAYLQGKLALVAPGWRFSGECQMVKQDGRAFPAEVHASVIEGEDGQPVGVTFITQDATARQRMEQYMRRTERLAAIGQMAAVLAHEIRNPLQAIQSSVELVVDYLVDPAEREEYLRHSFQEIERLTEITNRVLNFSDPEPVTFHAMPVRELLQRAVALIDRRLALANVHLSYDVEADLPPVYVSPDQIVQVLVHLLSNAIEAMPGGGRIEVAGWLKEDFVHITVTNSGPAIPAELLDRIFDPFFSTKATGAGLGLTISDSMVQQHGGILSVQNLADNQGVTFTVALPVAPLEQI